METILISTDRLLASSGDSAEMVRQARILGEATAQLIQAIKVTGFGYFFYERDPSVHVNLCEMG